MTGPMTRCPWCSAELSIPGAESCLVCGAALVSETGGPDPEIKGVTTLDTEAILRARSAVAHPRSRLLSFITGEPPIETGGPASPGSLSRPPDEVRREMLRLQLEAEQADLVAEAVALRSDEFARRGIHLSQLGGEPEATGLTADEDEATAGDPGATAGEGETTADEPGATAGEDEATAGRDAPGA